MSLDLGVIRQLYSEAADSYTQGRKLYKMLEKEQANLTGVFCAYWGAALAIEAKNSFNVFYKLHYIQKANDFFTKSIKDDPEDIESRFLRFSIQINTPAILGYSGDIEKDKTHILTNIAESPVDLDMRIAIADFLLNSKRCLPSEIEQLKLFLSTKL